MSPSWQTHIHEAEATFIRHIFEMAGEGKSLATITQLLIAEKAPALMRESEQAAFEPRRRRPCKRFFETSATPACSSGINESS